MDMLETIANMHKTSCQNTHLSGQLLKKSEAQENSLQALKKRVSRISRALEETEAMREHVAVLSENVDILSEQVMTLSELNHGLTQLVHKFLGLPDQTEARDNVTNIKRNV